MSDISKKLEDIVRWLRALEARLGLIIENETGEMKRHFEERRGVYVGIAEDLERLWKLTPADDRVKDRLIELYTMAEQYMTKPPTPESRKKLAELRERNKNVDLVTALENIRKGLEPRLNPGCVSATSALWDRWDEEKDIHQKTLLQLELGACVSGLFEHIEALEEMKQRTRGQP